MALILIFILPGCWSGESQENGAALSSSTPEEGAEKREEPSEVQPVRARTRPPAPPSATLASKPAQEPAAHHAPARLASVASKPHPSRFSVRRLQ